MNDETEKASEPKGERSREQNAPLGRHLIVLGIAIVGVLVGIMLVMTGRKSEPTPTPTSIAAAPLLADLGNFADRSAAKSLVETLDPITLDPRSQAATSSPTAKTPTSQVGSGEAELTLAGLGRCQGAIVQQNTDRSLGSRLAARRLTIASKPAFVVSFALPGAQTSPAGTRVLIVDAMTCRVLDAVEHVDEPVTTSAHP